MSKLLIALLAFDIGFSLSKVFIFTWKLNYLLKKKQFFYKQEIFSGYYLFDIFILKNTKLNQQKNFLQVVAPLKVLLTLLIP